MPSPSETSKSLVGINWPLHPIFDASVTSIPHLLRNDILLMRSSEAYYLRYLPTTPTYYRWGLMIMPMCQTLIGVDKIGRDQLAMSGMRGESADASVGHYPRNHGFDTSRHMHATFYNSSPSSVSAVSLTLR